MAILNIIYEDLANDPFLQIIASAGTGTALGAVAGDITGRVKAKGIKNKEAKKKLISAYRAHGIITGGTAGAAFGKLWSRRTRMRNMISSIDSSLSQT